MAWKELPDRERPLRIDKPYIAFSQTQIIFGAKFLKDPDNDVFYLRSTDQKIYVNFHIDEINKKLGFEFKLEFTPKSSKLQFHKYGWTAYVSNYRLLRFYPELQFLCELKTKFTPIKEGDFWAINLEDYWK